MPKTVPTEKGTINQLVPKELVRERLPDVVRLAANDADALARAAAMLREESSDPYALGAVHEAALANALSDPRRARRYVPLGSARRSAGAHYTPRDLAREV